MPEIVDFIIGPIADIYVGNFGDPDVLEWMDAPRTQGGRFRYAKPDKWEVGANADCQTSLCQVSMDLVFYWSEQAVKIAMQNSLSTANIDDTPTGQKYVVLLLTPDPESESSILLPVCTSLCLVENPFSKTECTTLPVNFKYVERNKQIKIQRRGTYAELKAILGSRSPI